MANFTRFRWNWHVHCRPTGDNWKQLLVEKIKSTACEGIFHGSFLAQVTGAAQLLSVSSCAPLCQRFQIQKNSHRLRSLAHLFWGALNRWAVRFPKIMERWPFETQYTCTNLVHLWLIVAIMLCRTWFKQRGCCRTSVARPIRRLRSECCEMSSFSHETATASLSAMSLFLLPMESLP